MSKTSKWLLQMIAATMSKDLRRAFASLLFSTHTTYLSANFFLYLLFVERMIPWSSGCIMDVAFGGNMRNLMWEYSRTWWLDALSQTYSIWRPAVLIWLLSFVIIWWCIHQSSRLSLKHTSRQPCLLPAFCTLPFKQRDILDLPMIDNFLWSEPSMSVMRSKVSLSLRFADPAGLSLSKQ